MHHTMSKSLLFLFLLSFLTFVDSDDDCPDLCVCKWKSGKETTECVDLGLAAIPANIAAGTQVLDLRGNSLRSLRDNIFVKMGITNLQRIYFPDCQISEVEPKSFSRLTNLVELDLSNNQIREIPSEAWRFTEALMRLHLAGNPVRLIRSNAFQKLKFVTYLDLANCHVETIETGAFDGMNALQEIRLEGNRLNYLHGAGLFPKELNHIEVSAIPNQTYKHDHKAFKFYF